MYFDHFLNADDCCWLLLSGGLSGVGVVCWLMIFLMLFVYEATEGIMGRGYDLDFWLTWEVFIP